MNSPDELLIEYLLGLSQQVRHELVLIPVDDKAAILVADQAQALRERFLFPEQPAGLARTLSSKKDMHFLCKRMSVPTPRAVFPQSRDDIEEFVQTVVFPVVIKPIVGWLPDNRVRAETVISMKSVTIVNSPEEVLKEYAKATTLGDPNIMLQEYIPGGPEATWMFNGVFTNNSECLVSFTGKKIRENPHAGMTTLGICLKNETVEKTAIDFLQRIGYSGAVDMDYRYDRRDGQYKLLDVNPRVGWTFRLFVDSNGMDVVRALYLYLTGQFIHCRNACEGRKWIVEQDDLISSLRYGRAGRLTLSDWVRSIRGIDEGAWFAWDDLLPFAAMCWALLVEAGRKLKDKTKAAQMIRKLLEARKP